MGERLPVDPVANSVTFERMAEAVFLGELQQEMWFARDEVIDVLTSTADVFGYDVVLKSANQERQVQLKTKRKEARTSRYDLQKSLEGLSSACVIVLEWSVSDDRLAFSYRWLGAEPGKPIPSLGDRIAKHSKGNAQGQKNPRTGLRTVGIGRFEKVLSISELASRLFGPLK